MPRLKLLLATQEYMVEYDAGLPLLMASTGQGFQGLSVLNQRERRNPEASTPRCLCLATRSKHAAMFEPEYVQAWPKAPCAGENSLAIGQAPAFWERIVSGAPLSTMSELVNQSLPSPPLPPPTFFIFMLPISIYHLPYLSYAISFLFMRISMPAGCTRVAWISRVALPQKILDCLAPKGHNHTLRVPLTLRVRVFPSFCVRGGGLFCGVAVAILEMSCSVADSLRAVRSPIGGEHSQSLVGNPPRFRTSAEY